MASHSGPQENLSKLTEFAPLHSEVKRSSGFFSRFFKKNVEEGTEVVENQESGLRDEEFYSQTDDPENNSSQQNSAELGEFTSQRGQNSYESSTSQSSASLNENHTRTLSSVLKHLGNILERRSQTPQAYKDSDFKQYWMPDSNCKECYECGDKFNAFRRRHHCRICGQIFCSRCCNQEVPGRIMGYTGFLRVCKYCCRVVLSYAQNQELSSMSLREDLSSLTTNESEAGAFQDSAGRLTPTPRKKTRTSFMDEESHGGQRSSSSPAVSPVARKVNFCDMLPACEYSPSVAQELKILTQDSAQLRNLWILMQHPIDGIEMQNHRHRIRTYQNCIVGSELIDWLISRDKASSRVQGVAIGQALVDAEWLECVTSTPQIFRDEYALYKAGQATCRENQMAAVSPGDVSLFEDIEEPLWLREIKPLEDSDDSCASETMDAAEEETSQSVFYVESKASQETNESGKRPQSLKTSTSSGKEGIDGQDFAISAISEELWRGVFHANNRSRLDSDLGEEWRSTEHLREENGERLAYERLSKSHKEHITWLTKHLLNTEGLSHKWSEIIISLVRKITMIVRPDVCEDNDDMDIRQYVQIKKIAGGNKAHTGIVCGVVCTKNVAYKKMARELMNPRILLLSSAIEYQRFENKFSSLEPQILQESEFLKNWVARIAAAKPDIVLVEKTVSRVAQDYLLEAGITLVLNVKPSVMERVSRFTQAEIVSSKDGGLLNRPNVLGFCHTFRLQTFSLPGGKNKTLMFFDGCASHLGCTVTLRGGPLQELKKVKKILQFMTFVAYNSKLEMSFMMDCFAMPPPAPDEAVLSIDGLNSHDGSPVDGVKIENQLDASVAGSQVTNLSEQLPLDMDENIIDANPEKDKSNIPVEDVIKETNLSVISHKLKKDEDTAPTMEPRSEETATSDSDAIMCSPREDENYQTLPSETLDHRTPIERYVNLEISEFDRVMESETSRVSSMDDKTEDMSVSGSVKESKVTAFANRDIDKCADILMMSTESKKSSHGSKPTEVLDFSDPLHNYQKSHDDSIFQSKVQFKEVVRKHSHKFRKALDDVILSCSPYMKYQVPYLETDIGTNCALREYFPEEIYWSVFLDEGNRRKPLKYYNEDVSLKRTEGSHHSVMRIPPHQFVFETMTTSMTETKAQSLLADFRARGGQLKRVTVANQNRAKLSQQADVEASYEAEDRDRHSQWRRKVDCLDPFHHQRIAVLFSTFSYSSINPHLPCVIPWVVNMDFYGRNDITLGGFLERYCFREAYHCPSSTCDAAMVHHIRRFVHENGSIQIVLKLLESDMPSYNNNILMWGWCRKCKQVTPVVPMSRDTWNLSFGKYLEVRFHGDCYGRRSSKEACSHSICQDHYQYFGLGRIVASFKYSKITLREISLPPPLISVNNDDSLPSNLTEECQVITQKGIGIYSHVLEHLQKLARDAQTDGQAVTIADFISQLQGERDGFKKCVDHILNQLIDYSDQMSEDPGRAGIYAIQDTLTNTKRKLAESVQCWNCRIQEIVQVQKKLERNRSQATLMRSRDSSGNVLESAGIDISSVPKVHVTEDATDDDVRDSFNIPPEDGATLPLNDSNGSHAITIEAQGKSDASSCSSSSAQSIPVSMVIGIGVEAPSSGFLSITGSHSSTPLSSSPADGETGEDADGKFVAVDKEVGHTRHKSLEDGKKKMRLDYDEVDSGRSDRRSAASMKNLFTSLISGSGVSHVQMPFAADEHYLLPACEKIPVIVYDNEPSSIIAYALSSAEYEVGLQQLKLQRDPAQNSSSPSVRRSTSKSSEGGVSESENPSSAPDSGAGDLKKRSGGRVLSFFRGSSVSSGPKEKVVLPVPPAISDVDTVKYTPQTDRDSMDEETEDDFASFCTGSDSEKNKSGKSHLNYHVELQFCDNSANFYCRVYFADQFRKLRKLIFMADENRYIRSLSRCFTWLARGGKSGSAFCKTQDDRFILKQMSRLEVQSFVEFAPFYFQYITKSRSEQKPTVLAKILGVYRIGYKNSQTNTAQRQDLLVMENLFYNRRISQIYDLKGSVRNRLVNTAEKPEVDVVLQDENLLKMSVDSPLYIRPHSKTALTLAITNDTQFLSSQLVMDYSLLVGLDDQRKELVVGIIDYIRTFTWDKKLEMVVKSTYNQVSGQGKMPTVVSPELYRTRFLEAMNSYFLLVPDRWAGLGFNVDC